MAFTDRIRALLCRVGVMADRRSTSESLSGEGQGGGLGEQITTIGGLPFIATQFGAAVADVARCEPGQVYRFANTYSIAYAHRIKEYGAVLAGSGRNYPDGAPVVGVQRLLVMPWGSVVDRVRGPSVFRAVLDQAQQNKTKHFFLGGESRGELDVMLDRLRREFPALHIVGGISPDFAPVTDYPYDDWMEEIRSSECDMVWVGLGTPKQDYVAHELSLRGSPACATVGAAFGFVAGTRAEAPPLLQSLGFEWMYRLATEPRRLWRRYLFGGVTFVGLATADVWKMTLWRLARFVSFMR